ncbi:hypothetical protein PGT21_020241 [Puccinia graminis f. sp. tritici]|uniref:Uncharacterized protein n=1 Tax=Puccinia graminis f. sp. tritici TaxID=56615 RepID=A0A5B0MQ85_PUCGR|nr:hypothetical protein PGTUg99_006179 [Puccinia graminis f. sp. tritici]KAA1084180.1 hypothetical protein PGT21_020241 [Puccinia graminis f. sp. tritici]
MPVVLEHLQQSRDWAIFNPNQRLAGEFRGPAEPQLDPQLIAPHLAPGYKPKAIAAVAETGYSLLATLPSKQSLVVYQSLATWPTAPCSLLPVCCGSSVTDVRQVCEMRLQAAIRAETDPGSAGDALKHR